MNEQIPASMTDTQVINAILNQCVSIEGALRHTYDTVSGTSNSLSDGVPTQQVRAADSTARAVSVFSTNNTGSNDPVVSTDIFEDGCWIGRLTPAKPWLDIGPVKGVISATQIGTGTSRIFQATYGIASTAPVVTEYTENEALVRTLNEMRNIEAALLDNYTSIKQAQFVIPRGTRTTLRAADPTAIHADVIFAPTAPPISTSLVQVYYNSVMVGLLTTARQAVAILGSGVGLIEGRNLGTVTHDETVACITRSYIPA